MSILPNIILDVFAKREPFFADSSRVFSFVENGKIEGLIGATTVTTISYLLDKAIGQANSRIYLSKLLTLMEIASIDAAVLGKALQMNHDDFEDSVLEAAAIANSADGIVTRDLREFAKSSIPIYSPVELIGVIETL